MRVGFIRFPSGSISTPVLDPYDTDTFTILRHINDARVIAGFYGLNVSHGFLLLDGEFVSRDFPGALGTSNLGGLSFISA